MNAAEFDALAAQGYNRIPVVREIFADLDTPLSTYLKLAAGPYSYLLESVQGGEKWGRYSIIGLPCSTVLRVRGPEVTVHVAGRETERERVADPLAWIEAFAARYRVAPVAGPLRYTGGLMGYFGYDTVRYVEPRLAHCDLPDRLETPDILLMVSDELVVFDNLSGRAHLIVHADPGPGPGAPDAYARAEARLDDLVAQMDAPLPAHAVLPPAEVGESDFVSGFTQDGFEAAVRRAKEYIAAGDVMQVVLSQRLSVPLRARPLDLYRALRGLNPSPYMYYLDLEDFHIVGSSPEILVRLEEGEVTVRPIAGTRPRGKSDEEDRALELDLLADAKELAEHLMLIDLGRNDVGRIADIGSVHLTERMTIERYSHVMHIVSNVVGRLRAGQSALDVLRATFPAGTVSGAPKIRAMEIIDELEPVKRSVYAGAVGYLGWGGNMDTAIAIRTAVIKDGTLHVQAGAGIVADSDPTREWEETMNKARAMFRAVALAEAGLSARR
ncbi:anthranilate synthase component I [Ectothiorhodospiraceae bacterium 2226]|nr:anthranilate synthase component I [Ectothiorhodospiraceae bacterium 2226]